MSYTKQDGGPAFPCWEVPDERPHQGMSLRDYLIGQALAGVMTGAQGLGEATKEQRANLFAAMATVLCEAADAVLKAREK